MYGKGICRMKLEHSAHARESKGDGSCGDTTDQKGKQRTHGKVYHQDLKHEDKTCDGSFEYTCHGTGCATTNEQHHVAAGEMEHSTKITTNGTTCQDDRCLGSDTTTKTNGDGRGKYRGKGVVQLDFALIACNSKEYLRHTMTNVISDYISDEQHCQTNTHDGENEVQPVGTRAGEAVCEEMLDGVDNPLQCPSCQGSKHTHNKAYEQHKALITNCISMAASPA